MAISTWKPPRPGALALHVLLPFGVGGLIYVLFRAQHLLMFQWFEAMGLGATVQAARAFAAPHAHQLPGWVLYSLPDGAWVYAATAANALIWRDAPGLSRTFWVWACASIAIGGEIAQLSGAVPGVFDPIDLLAYLVAHFAALSFISRTRIPA